MERLVLMNNHKVQLLTATKKKRLMIFPFSTNMESVFIFLQKPLYVVHVKKLFFSRRLEIIGLRAVISARSEPTGSERMVKFLKNNLFDAKYFSNGQFLVSKVAYTPNDTTPRFVKTMKWQELIQELTSSANLGEVSPDVYFYNCMHESTKDKNSEMRNTLKKDINNYLLIANREFRNRDNLFVSRVPNSVNE